jgi:hypothetical protein
MPRAPVVSEARVEGWQCPFEQVPPSQLYPQLPQLFASVRSSTQTLEHAV